MAVGRTRGTRASTCCRLHKCGSCAIIGACGRPHTTSMRLITSSVRPTQLRVLRPYRNRRRTALHVLLTSSLPLRLQRFIKFSILTRLLSTYRRSFPHHYRLNGRVSSPPHRLSPDHPLLLPLRQLQRPPLARRPPSMSPVHRKRPSLRAGLLQRRHPRARGAPRLRLSQHQRRSPLRARLRHRHRHRHPRRHRQPPLSSCRCRHLLRRNPAPPHPPPLRRRRLLVRRSVPGRMFWAARRQRDSHHPKRSRRSGKVRRARSW